MNFKENIFHMLYNFPDNIRTAFQVSIRIILLCLFLSFVNITKVIKIDNLDKQSLFEKNINFSQYETEYKILAIFYPLNYIENRNYVNNMTNSYIHENKEIKVNKKLIEQQVKLAKNHGIYGFGIAYNWIINAKLNEEILDLFLYEKTIDFPFFIIFHNSEEEAKNYSIYNKNNVTFFIDSIQKYLMSDNYIRYNEKYILGFFYSPVTSELVKNFRTLETKKGENSFYIISISYGNRSLENFNLTNSLIEFPSQEIGLGNNLNQKYFYNFYYPNLLSSKSDKPTYINNFFIINGCQPEKFYVIFKKYLNLTKPQKNSFLIFNAWNNYQKNSYLEPDEEFGFAYLNFFSKAIFNIANNYSYNLEQLNNKSKIAIQVHLFYEDLISDIINKTNNIPVKFDLYISIISQNLYDFLNHYIKSYSKADYYEIIVSENKGRDVLPFLIQIKTKIKNYKYLCHIHSKKSQTSPEIGFLWRNYLYNNLLGNENIISGILYDFENNKKLGFIP